MRPAKLGTLRSPGLRFITSSSLLAIFLAIACSSQDSGIAQRQAANPKGNPAIGEPDTNTGKGLSLDESKLRATLSNSSIQLTIPTSIASGRLAAEWQVDLLDLLSGNTVATTQAAFDVSAGSPQDVSAALSLPSGVTTQPPLVQSVVRISNIDQGVTVKRSLLYTITPYELRLEGPSTPRLSKKAVYRVVTQDPITRQPLAHMPVTISATQNDQTAWTYSGTSDDLGVFEQSITPAATGSYSVTAGTQQGVVLANVTDTVNVQSAESKLLLTTDKPIYQPGQVIHLRGLALASGNQPISNSDATFEIADAKGNKIYKHTLSTDSYGVISADFQLGNILNQGTFKIDCTLQGQTSEKTVQVSQYALPKFQIGIGVDRGWYAPGDTVQGTVDSSYFFGKPVTGGDVVIEAASLDVGTTTLGRIVGKTDSAGHYAFTYTLPKSLIGLPLEQGNALINLHVTVTDTAGQQVQKDQLVTVASQPVNVVVIPESGEVVAGVENRLLTFVSDPQGNPITGAAVNIDLGNGSALSGTSDAYGECVLAFTPSASVPQSVNVTVTPSSGAAASKTVSLLAQSGNEHVLVRTDKAVYQTGDVITVNVTSTASSPSVYVDWLNDGQAVDMRTLSVTNGSASFTMPVDTSSLGTNRIEAYVVDDDGNIVRTGRTVFAHQVSSLSVSMTSDASSYKPAATAHLTFNVTDEQGQPAVAALGLQVVDEAVYSLIDAKPGLLETFFELEDAYANPTYEVDPPPGNLMDLLFHDTTVADPAQAAASQTRAQATLAAIGTGNITGVSDASWASVVSKAKSLAQPYFDALTAQLKKTLTAATTDAMAQLQQQGCSFDYYYSTCGSNGKTSVQVLAENLTSGNNFYDAWGNALTGTASTSYNTFLTFTSRGPDETAGTTDDVNINISYTDLGLSSQVAYPMAFDVNGAAAATGGAMSIDIGAAGSNSSDTSSVRVRQNFPETLYVNPEVITGADGKASIDLPLADSITQWRVSMLANSQAGRLGSATAGLTVFQDFFVDIDFPATLTRGDHVEFPITVYNYLDTPQSVEVTLDAANWYQAQGQTDVVVDLQPGEVKGLRFPVDVEQVGVNSLVVHATGPQASDAVARTVRVVSDGKAIAQAQSGALAQGSMHYDVSLPTGAISGSQQLYLQVFPAYTSQVVQGLDSLLRVPTGCFEQTTSTTWPNVLVTKYLKASGQLTPDIQMKAESLMSAGYQRLLTFEHPGGGFSWFGTQDPAPYLSVTAFGVMEFADMAAVQTVDDAMLTRTINWLASQQGADGSWTGDTSEFFTFQTSQVRNTAFTLWALASASYSGNATNSALNYLKAHYTDGTPDAYTLALVANAFALVAPNDPTLTDVLARIDALKAVDGDKVSWDTGGTQTNFYGARTDGAVATTALVASALIQAGGDPKTIESALNFLVASKDTLGNYGSTQATVWTLRTLLLATTKGTQGAVGQLQVMLDGQSFTSLALSDSQANVMTTVDMTSSAALGNHAIDLNFVGSGKLSYNLVTSYNIPWSNAPADAQSPLNIAVSYDKTSMLLDDMVQATVTLKNLTTNDQNMVLLTLGIPPGFQVVTDDLDAYVQNKTISQYEMTGKQLIIYLTNLTAGSQLVLNYRLQATMPVKAADGGAEAHLYYDPSGRATAASTTLEAKAN